MVDSNGRVSAFYLYTGIAPATFDVTKTNMIKEQIINTAFDLFSQYGIKSVSMDDVAKAAGISKRTLYESFEDKETLLIEGIDHNSESLGQYLTGLEKEPFNALEVILLFYEEMMKNPRWFNEKFYEDLKKYPKAQQKIEMNKARMGKRCMDLFTRGVKEGVFRLGLEPCGSQVLKSIFYRTSIF